jgi:hypothetical protein
MKTISKPPPEPMSELPPAQSGARVLDLPETLEHTWQQLCRAYDATTDMPAMQTLFEGADLANPRQTAESVVANMLVEIIEAIGRFSSWYKQPATAFGLILGRDPVTNNLVWSLSPDGTTRWEALLSELTLAIRQNTSVIQAADLVEVLVNGNPRDPSYMMAACACVPPRVVLSRRGILFSLEIVCDACRQPFHPISDPPNMDSPDTSW